MWCRSLISAGSTRFEYKIAIATVADDVVLYDSAGGMNGINEDDDMIILPQ